MTDRFADKAADWDERPLPVQISTGVVAAIQARVPLSRDQTILDFGAGTGLVCTALAPHVGHVIAVDVSKAMLERLAEKPALQGKSTIVCRDIVTEPLDRQADGIVSAMALHHVEDTAALVRALFAHTTPGGWVALADLDAEDGDFHPPGVEGVYHAGFDRTALGALLADAGFVEVRFETATTVDRDSKRYPVFLVTARRPA
jgi:2-polyprenyl-3-methyl-5-hydroxy-6-metoxy-1,4-benzoquinol methylase